jgi:hypothetical protein
MRPCTVPIAEIEKEVVFPITTCVALLLDTYRTRQRTNYAFLCGLEMYQERILHFAEDAWRRLHCR